LRGVINRVPDLLVCGEAENAPQAMNAVQKLAPDLALVDITLPGKSGLELVKDLKVAHPQLAILAISMHDESLYAERVLRAGASGYITKQQPPEELIKAIRQVHDKHIYVSKQVSENLLRRISQQSAEDTSPVSLLTDREFEIMRLIGAGKAPREISRQLHLSPKTIAVHTSNVRRKLNLKTTAKLIRFAVQLEEMRNPTQD
jgi:DNA-binding NarL/FixJ family response regulator